MLLSKVNFQELIPMKRIEEDVLLDTNVLIYATLKSDHRHPIASSLLTKDNRKSANTYISVQNLAEMYPNITGPKMSVPDSPSVAKEKIVSIINLSYVTILPLSIEVQMKTLELCEKYSVTKQRYFDFQLIATMLVYDIKLLMTENDKDFTGVQEIKVFNPFT